MKKTPMPMKKGSGPTPMPMKKGGGGKHPKGC